jgi:hypothetical protein
MKWPIAVALVWTLHAQTTVRISEIQGPGSASPLVGAQVETTGVVTARRTNGFYIQSRPQEGDGNPLTSEGLLVFTRVAPPATAVRGALVRVRGLVTEFRPASDAGSAPLTELTEPQVEVLSADNPVPPPVTITANELFPAGGVDVLERFEGMRVRFDELRAVSPTVTTGGVFFAVLEGTPRPFREPGVDFDGNPERLRIDPMLLGVTALPVFTGLRWRDVTGVLDYGFRTYTVGIEQSLSPSAPALPAVTPILEPSPQEISVASMNLRRLAASDAARIAQIGTTIRAQLHLPDLVAVQEVVDLPTLERVADAAGPAYRAYLEEGNDPGGIDVGFLVNTSTVNVLSVQQVDKEATYRTPAGAAAVLHDRPPLVLRATVRGLPFNAVVVHMRSLIDAETPTVRAKRLAQAEAVAELASRIQAENPAAGLLLLGDFNAFQFDDGLVDVVGIIATRAGLFNLTQALPRDEGYSYVQDGTAQTLDHVLANGVMRRRWSRYQMAHLNADLPDTLRRYSDHDHPVAHFVVTPAPGMLTASSITSAATFLNGKVTPGQLVTVFNPTITPDTTLLLNGGGVGLFSVAPGQATFTVPQLGLLRVQLANQGLLSNEVSILATPVATPGVFGAWPTPGDPRSVDLYITGWTPESLHVWVGGRLADELTSPAPYILRARLPAEARRRAGPAEVLLVVGDQTSQPGVMVDLPNP